MSCAQDTGRSLETVESFFDKSVSQSSNATGPNGAKFKAVEEDRVRLFKP